MDSGVSGLLAAAARRRSFSVSDYFQTVLRNGDGASSFSIGTNLKFPATSEGLLLYRRRASIDDNIFIPGNNVGYLKTNSQDSYAGTVASTFGAGSVSLSSIPANSNNNTEAYVAWLWRKHQRFYKAVAYTGDGTSGRAIAHTLSGVPGMVWIKPLAGATDWIVWHRTMTLDHIALNGTSGETNSTVCFSSAPDATNIYLTSASAVNQSGVGYQAFFFAHDTASDGIVQCGEWTGNGVAGGGPTVSLGWQPQWLLMKRRDSTSQWNVIDTARTPSFSGNDAILQPNNSTAENTSVELVGLVANGFQVLADPAASALNISGAKVIYMAIRA